MKTIKRILALIVIFYAILVNAFVPHHFANTIGVENETLSIILSVVTVIATIVLAAMMLQLLLKEKK